MIRFIDRDIELKVLNDAWNQTEAQLIVIYGRRRIGKTTLLSEFVKDKPGLYHIAADIYTKIQISEFRTQLSYFLEDDFLEKTVIDDWGDLFNYLSKVMPTDRRFFLVIDEFTYLSKNDRSILSRLQRFWDTFLANTRIFLVICGSDLGMILDNVLSYTSPLYGRRTRDIYLTGMSFEDSIKFTSLGFEESLMLFMTIGGVPEYLNKAEQYTDFYYFVMREFGDKNGYFYREPYFTLSQEFKDYNTYLGILNAIAFGKNKPSEISNFIGLQNKRLYPYLENLIKLGYLVKSTPFMDRRKEGHFEMADFMLEFWFNYVYVRREFIERGTKYMEFDFRSYFGRIFEKVIRNEIYPKIYPTHSVGKWWFKDHEIDLVSVTQDLKEMIVGECKWSEQVDPAPIVKKLISETSLMLRGKEVESIEYHIIAKSFKNKKVKGDVILVDLDEIERVVKGTGK